MTDLFINMKTALKSLIYNAPNINNESTPETPILNRNLKMKLTVKSLDEFYRPLIITDLIDLIGWRLAHIFRFAGESPISVALHTLIVAELVRQNQRDIDDRLITNTNSLHALMHDAHESFIGDIPAPVCDYLDEEHGLAIEKITAKVRSYLGRRCLLDTKYAPAAVRGRAQELVRKSDNKAAMEEYAWLKKNQYAIRRAKDNRALNCLIQDLIRQTIPDRFGGIFENVGPDNTIVIDWCNPKAMQTLWEDNLRRTTFKLQQMQREEEEASILEMRKNGRSDIQTTAL